MARQISTAVSDFFLACSIVFVVNHLYQASVPFAAIGLTIQGVAASVGIVRFFMLRSEMGPVFRMHKFMSWLSTTAGMGLVSYEFCLKHEAVTTGHLVMSFAIIVTMTTLFMNAENKKLFVEACSGLSLLTILILSVCYYNIYGVAAAVIYILSGAIIGSEGTLLGLRRVDLLHYGLIVGNMAFMKALL
ncbi:uncharacterized protein LOC127870951 [Dreissena polymorpha]|uniref:Uncharacterized protein n=1 Tax=Dreissena polymorpha TaxID=45954 RepID=A0A9D4LB14_DREPO|nr:uncharacterized protein LOC127870951 [Dreissena polymorpha]XP_052269512.1 uncharacterized protein LOC127870951 [Dreissena polymorpha]XP_052269514.1 uncharacterized protein LOC127870951 [Dreissena polymorpha]KAH3855173.1 hypothetical protein DPMN_097735 [Dreissena polymorpha]